MWKPIDSYDGDCPNCGSMNVETISMEIDEDGDIYADKLCMSCKEEFTLHYVPAEIFVYKSGDDNE